MKNKEKAKGKAGVKKAEKAREKGPSSDPRLWTPAQRREMFLEARKEVKDDYRILDKDFREELVPYGNIVLDHVLSLGGLPRHARVTQVHGDEGAGKTTTALCIAAQYQRVMQEPIAIFEYEPGASATYAWTLGVDPSLCFFEQPTSLQDAIKRHVQLMADFGVRLFVNDSIPYMETKIPRKDFESGRAFKSSYGGHAKGIKGFYHMLHPWLLEYDGSLLMVNQTRDRIDEDADNASKWSYTNRIYSLPGGREARFTPSVMLELTLENEVRPWEWKSIPDEKEKWLLVQPKGAVLKNYPTANRVRVRSLKNKVTGMGFREGHIYIRPNFGIDENMSIRELGCAYGYIGFDKKRWSVGKSAEEGFASYASKTELVEALVVKEDPEVLGKLRALIVEAIKSDDSGRFKWSGPQEEIASLEKIVNEEYAPLDDEEDFKEEAAVPGESIDLDDADRTGTTP